MKSHKIKIVGVSSLILLSACLYLCKDKLSFINSANISGIFSSATTVAPPPTSSTGVVLSTSTTLTLNTEKKKVYTINHIESSGPITNGCNQKEYKPDLGGGKNGVAKNVLGPFNFPVKLTFKLSDIDDNLKINTDSLKPNTVVVDKTNAIGSDSPCSHHHILDYTQTIPANTPIAISIIDQHGGSAAMVGTLTVENTVLKDTLADLKNKAATATHESGATGAWIATFRRGMTKKYVGPASDEWPNETVAMGKILADTSKYGTLMSVTDIHSHVVESGISKHIDPPSVEDLTALNKEINEVPYPFRLTLYEVDSSGTFWNYATTDKLISKGDSDAMIQAENKMRDGKFAKTDVQNYVNVVNTHHGFIQNITSTISSL